MGDTAGGLFEVTVRKEVTTAGSPGMGVVGVVMDDEVSSVGWVVGVDDVEEDVVVLDVSSSGSPVLDEVDEDEGGVVVEEEGGGVTEEEVDELGGGGVLEELGTELEELQLIL